MVLVATTAAVAVAGGVAAVVVVATGVVAVGAVVGAAVGRAGRVGCLLGLGERLQLGGAAGGGVAADRANQALVGADAAGLGQEVGAGGCRGNQGAGRDQRRGSDLAVPVDLAAEVDDEADPLLARLGRGAGAKLLEGRQHARGAAATAVVDRPTPALDGTVARSGLVGTN